jgi:hypothetical protein
MARRVNASATLEDLIYFSGKDVSVSIDEEDLEEVLDVFNIAKPTSNPNVAQDNERDRQSMYVMLFERECKGVAGSISKLAITMYGGSPRRNGEDRSQVRGASTFPQRAPLS